MGAGVLLGSVAVVSVLNPFEGVVFGAPTGDNVDGGCCCTCCCTDSSGGSGCQSCLARCFAKCASEIAKGCVKCCAKLCGQLCDYCCEKCCECVNEIDASDLEPDIDVNWLDPGLFPSSNFTNEGGLHDEWEGGCNE